MPHMTMNKSEWLSVGTIYPFYEVNMKTAGFRMLSYAPRAERDFIMKTESDVSFEGCEVFPPSIAMWMWNVLRLGHQPAGTSHRFLANHSDRCIGSNEQSSRSIGYLR